MAKLKNSEAQSGYWYAFGQSQGLQEAAGFLESKAIDYFRHGADEEAKKLRGYSGQLKAMAEARDAHARKEKRQ